MSRWDETYEERYERRREEERQYRADVVYEAWRRGLDPDRAAECALDCREAGRRPEECVDGYAREVRRERERREEERYQEEMAERAAWDAQQQQPPEAQP